MAVSTYTKSGNKATAAAKLDKNIFDVSVENHELLKQAYVAYLANGRTSAAVTKTRGLVSGGGKKPWKQKGTGRARFGSSRNPIWRGGGIVFGPTGLENYTHKQPTTAKRVAIRQALSVANASDKLIILEDFTATEKTSEAASLFAKIGVTNNALLVVETKSEQVTRSTRNLSYVKVVQAKYINVFDLMNADNVVITKGALEIITEWLGVTK